MPFLGGRILGTGGLTSGGATPVATYTVTTTGAATHTIAALTVSASTIVDWGDGSSNAYTGAGARTHDYAGAGTWTVTVRSPLLVTALTLSDNKVTLNSALIKTMTNCTTFNANNCKAGRFDSADVSAWRPTDFRLTGMPAGYAGTFNSSDVSAWRPTTFYLYTMPAGYAGTFNSSDVSAWRPTTINISVMPSGYAGTFNSSDVSAWRPTLFSLDSMPAGYAGTFNSSDVSAWRPTNFYLISMPAGYAGTFNSSDVSAWRPTTFRLYSMPVATFTITITANGFAGYAGCNSFQMQGNSFSAAQVDALLWDLYQAAIAPRTATGGTINVSGNNAAPSGTYQACASPPVTAATPGKEIAHELINDTIGAFANHWTTVTTS